ncbi:MAG: tyrosine--tRNA ligase [Candidatus Komeilibacteria bacterium CG10_big_fil_rev_8_21_14_0_10_41_13]|uniref:Tyrosine--tRNA ligase n=1 Tax=Candidatus Komeilibacteria bacterium CG10_big_fil_rev_8_21_14_0_10_41_13 TaxID=1974476 RepID=A0A2M6WDI3_9BACT|nr:MAG: tyrosine--tRNA ligase [Candidatus Komeilibacteria bacterium CG10_big_fil_rev_8_21_14_0_10_41_13]
MTKVITDSKKIEELLTRGVDEVIQLNDLKKKLLSGKKLRVKLGIDPTSPNLHLGRAIPLLKLRDFQELGHQLVFIVGDFTGVIGDTSDKDSERPMLTTEAIRQNMKDYVKQASKVIDIKRAEVHYNSKWLKKLTYDEIGQQADQFSVAEFIARENIKKRMDQGKRVSLREVLYPLMQGYDSVMVKADVEVGGTDQRFNLLAGRKLQEYFNQAAQNIIMGPLMEGTDGRKMSSSWGNTVNLTHQPSEMFGKLMSIPDELIIKYFTLATRVSLNDIKGIESQLKAGANPRDVKAKLAKEIVKMYHGDKAALESEEAFEKQFKNKEIPDDIKEVKITHRKIDIIDLLVEAKLVASKSEGRRMVEQGGVRLDGEKIISLAEIEIKSGMVIQVGKRKFARIK